DLSPGENVAYAPTAEIEAQASPLRHIVDPADVALVAYGTNEGKMRDSAEELAKQLQAKGVKTRLLVLQGEDHKDTALSFGAHGSTLANAVLQLIGVREGEGGRR